MPTHSSNSRSRIAVLITTFAALLCITPWLTGPAQAAQQPGGAVAAPKTAATDVGQRLERFEDRDTTREKDWAGSADETMEACARFNAVAQNVTTQVKLVEDAGGPLDYAKTGVVPQRLGGLGIAACGEVVAVADFCSDAVVGSPVPVAVIDNWRDAIAAKGRISKLLGTEDLTVLATEAGNLGGAGVEAVVDAADAPTVKRLKHIHGACVEAGRDDDKGRNISALGSLDGIQDALIRGVAAFISARLKAELELMVQERIADDLCTKEVADKLLPSSCEVARDLRAEDAPLVWGTIRTALQEDLERLPTTVLPMLVKLVRDRTDSDSEAAKAATTLLSLVPVLLDRLGKRGTPLSDLGELDGIIDVSTIDGAVLQHIGVLVQVILPEDGKQLASANYDRFGEVAATLVQQRLDLQLDAQQKKALVNGLIDLRIAADGLQREIRNAKKAQEEGKPRDEKLYGRLAVLTIHLFADAGELALSLPIDGIPEDTRKTMTKVLKMSPTLVEAITAGQDRDYPKLLTSSLTLVGDFEDILGVDLPDSVVSTLRKYGPFLVELASAEDAEGVEKALKAAAAPVGSYKVKRGWAASLPAARMNERIEKKVYSLDATTRTAVDDAHAKRYEKEPMPRRPLTVSINAFAGAKAGGEWLLGRDAELSETERRGGHVGLFMPVGIDVALGVGAASSVQVFASVIDVGALGDFRVGEEVDDEASDTAESDAEPRIGFVQVFSPGLYFAYGIHRTPLALGAGASFAPQYRRTSLDPATEPEELRSTFQVSAFLAVDIPMFVIGRRGGLKRKVKKKK